MGLLGRGGGKVGKLGALASAQPVLEGELRLHSTGTAGVCFKPRQGADAFKAEQDLEDLLSYVGMNLNASVRRRSDSYGFEWLAVRAGGLDELVQGVETVSSELQRRGFKGQLLAALFPFSGPNADTFLVYGFRSGTFWPFVPTGEGQERDNDEEIRLRDALKSQLPIEPRLEQWLGLFDAPIDD